MRFAILPLISVKKKILKESDWVTWKQLIHTWREEVFCYVLLHENADVPEDCEFENVEYVRLKHWSPYASDQATISSEVYELFNPVNGKYQVDAFWTSRSPVAANLKRLLDYNGQTAVPVYLVEMWVQEYAKLTDLDHKLRAVSYSECVTLFQSEREKKIALDSCRKYLAPAEFIKAEGLARVRSGGINAHRIAKLADSTPKFDTQTLLFAGRLNSNKHWKDVLEVYQDLFRMGHDIEIKVLSGSAEPTEHFDKVEVVKPLGYAEYLEFLCKCHVSVSMSREEGFSFGLLEQMCTGNPVLLPDTWWAWDLAGSKDYPFLYKNKKELYALLTWVLRNYADARTRMVEHTERIVEQHDVSVAAAEMLGVVDGTFVEFGEWDEKFHAVLAETPPLFSLLEFCNIAAKMYPGTAFGTYLIVIGAYRNIYHWLRSNAVEVRVASMQFVKNKEEMSKWLTTARSRSSSPK